MCQLVWLGLLQLLERLELALACQDQYCHWQLPLCTGREDWLKGDSLMSKF